MNEAYVTGRSTERAVNALREIILMGETEPIIDMYERAAWMSGASHEETQATSRQARADYKELQQLSDEIKELTASSNTSHNQLAAEVRALGMWNHIMDESK